MTVTTSYPGVYLSEEASLNFSVTRADTMVPAFAYYQYYSLPPGGPNFCFYSWQDVVAAAGDGHFAFIWYTSLYTWFSLGGGKCYLINYDQLEIAVKQFDDITTIVSAGIDSDNLDANHQSYVISAVNNIIAQGIKIFALFDGPLDRIAADDTTEAVMERFSSTPYAAVYYPWCSSSGKNKKIAPSVIAAVAIALTDRTRGVWKAPANVVINGITPLYPVTDDLQGQFTQGKALNMIRTFPNVGTVVWGARTLDDSDNWRYIPVRRLFNMVERDIQKALNKLVFEPNSQPTWQRVKAAVNNYLHGLWKQGALIGNKEEEAWFVEIGKDITMTEDDINQGKMIIKIGLAAVRPAEFIILLLSQDIAQ
ncbi:hypothetical protein EDF81_0788 [Enterobacter sp. BIGb0383]|uniref:phage tail sheath family protein n=1 Tax=unclassified Enterobacter TaxID=2608935 RepID=UPI000F49D1B2|nr:MULTISPECIES: phage tail sheath C-terminal domain-containing protein [unclassified Enterobacter]ROP62303.1 hypothetical protein EDF81_0788 [Enterobacter sp. BIGb0383]ROS12464.1 hypothetical protein EC848_0790 [Enterobacter sp. BIGb0359]